VLNIVQNLKGQLHPGMLARHCPFRRLCCLYLSPLPACPHLLLGFPLGERDWIMVYPVTIPLLNLLCPLTLPVLSLVYLVHGPPCIVDKLQRRSLPAGVCRGSGGGRCGGAQSQRDTVDGMTAMVAAKLVRELAARISK